MTKAKKIIILILFIVVGAAAALIAFYQTYVDSNKDIAEPQSCFSNNVIFEGYDGYGRLPNITAQKEEIIQTDLLVNTVSYADSDIRHNLEKQILKCFSVSSKAGHHLRNSDKVELTITADVKKLESIGVEVDRFTLKDTNSVTAEVKGLGDSYNVSDPFQYVLGAAIDRTDSNSIHILWNNDINMPDDITISPDIYSAGESVTLKASCKNHDAYFAHDYIDCGNGIILEPVSKDFTLEEWKSISEPESLNMTSVLPVVHKSESIAKASLGASARLRHLYNIYYPDTDMSKFCLMFSSGNEDDDARFALVTVGNTKADGSQCIIKPELYTYEIISDLSGEEAERLLSQKAVSENGVDTALPELTELSIS